MILKDIHLTCKDISNIYKEVGVPFIISYIFWYIILIIRFIYVNIKKVYNRLKIILKYDFKTNRCIKCNNKLQLVGIEYKCKRCDK